MTQAQVPLLTLNNGVEMPALGLRRLPDARPTRPSRAVEAALATGYRHIDTAAAYANEREVGEAIRRSGLDRDEVFIETKVWISDYGYDETLHAFDKSAGKLGVDQIDLLILHQPLPTAFDRTVEAYRALETLLADGQVRAIGVSNFMPEHLERCSRRRDVVPAVNQIELHPVLHAAATRAADARRARRSSTQAWSPIGGITVLPRGRAEEHVRRPDDPRDRRGARQVGRSGDAALAPAAGPLAIPKSVRPERIAENFDIFDFELSARARARSTPSTPACAAAPSPATSPSRATAGRSQRTEGSRRRCDGQIGFS